MLPKKIKILLYNLLVLSLLQHCHLVWGTTGTAYMIKIHLLQKRKDLQELSKMQIKYTMHKQQIIMTIYPAHEQTITKNLYLIHFPIYLTGYNTNHLTRYVN